MGPGFLGAMLKPYHLGPLIMLALAVAIFIRTKKVKVARRKKIQDGLKKGDSVVTSSGIIGKIVDKNAEVIAIETSPNIIIKIDRSFIETLTEIEI